MGLRRRPDIFLANGNGSLNAFAAQATGHDYVVLSNELFVNLYQNNRDGLRFILGHEMGHIRLHHVALWYQISVAYSERIPLLGPALSRLREYSCDGVAPTWPRGSTGLVLARLGPVHRTPSTSTRCSGQGKAFTGSGWASRNAAEVAPLHGRRLERLHSLGRFHPRRSTRARAAVARACHPGGLISGRRPHDRSGVDRECAASHPHRASGRNAPEMAPRRGIRTACNR